VDGLAGERVLIVEDEPNIALLLENTIMNSG